MKLIIAGGRDYELTAQDFHRLIDIRQRHNIKEIVSGACPTGADVGGETFAAEWEIPVRRFPADWAKWGKRAGPIRNAQMAEYADAVALFPGGRGTESMMREAISQGLRIFDFRT